ncbi:MAG TPA: hypothetical protein VI197_27765 [Polyangiaceae bacterium]
MRLPTSLPRTRPRRWVAALAASWVVGAWGRTTAADPALTAPEPESGVRTHDGLYLRFASGFGVYDELARSEDVERFDGRLRIKARGFAAVRELAVGGTPYPGLVIGGGIYGVAVVTSSVTTNRDDQEIELSRDVAPESRDLSIIGVFVDRYFVPALGLHVQAALGLANQYGVRVDGEPFNQGEYSPFGPGGLIGLGYETWVTDQWSLGVLARFGASVMFGKDAQGTRWVHYVTNAPSFLMTVTYH